ncbi:MAG: radical SAM family heme chaperone HemW [Acidobacteriota bacterium]
MIGLYVHVPYCTVRCSYCDFYLVTARGKELGAFVDAVCAEIASVPAELRHAAVDSVHLGGGTASLLPPASIERILAAARDTFRLHEGAEIGLEANPEDLTAESIRDLVCLGIGRLSIGVQSLDDKVLRTLGRAHSAERALLAVEAARRGGLNSVGADLILGAPGESPDKALRGMARLVASGVDHLSVYMLELHPRTRLGREAALGRVSPAGDDELAGLYERAADLLVGSGFEHYEISNFARPGHRSRHNLKYWTDQEYLGFGPGAHSYLAGRRWRNAPDLDGYIARGGAGAARVEDAQPLEVRAAEALCAGLRIAEGVDLAALRGRYGDSLPAPEAAAVTELERAGLVRCSGSRLRLTRRGRLLSNEVFVRLMPRTPGTGSARSGVAQLR